MQKVKTHSPEIDTHKFARVKHDGEQMYKSLGEVHCPYFNEKVTFNAKGVRRSIFGALFRSGRYGQMVSESCITAARNMTDGIVYIHNILKKPPCGRVL